MRACARLGYQRGHDRLGSGLPSEAAAGNRQPAPTAVVAKEMIQRLFSGRLAQLADSAAFRSVEVRKRT